MMNGKFCLMSHVFDFHEVLMHEEAVILRNPYMSNTPNL